MRKITDITRILAFAMTAAALCLWSCRPQMHTVIVDTRSQHYTHQRMMAELDSLAGLYPECVRYTIADTTHEGRPIPLVVFGNPDAPRHVMVQAAMHAREYLSAQMVMAMLENYAYMYHHDKKINGLGVRPLFSEVCFTILPMVNPDGVSISQKGIDGALTTPTLEWLTQMVDSGRDCTRIKSNARGVDINRNFPNGFAVAEGLRNVKDFDFYPGQAPLSEIESQLMMRTAQLHDYTCFLNYHTSGNLVYYGCGNAADNVNALAQKMAQLIENHTGFPGYGPDSAAPNGSWADEVEVRFLRPSATIELGTYSPVPVKEFPKLLRKNMPIWADLASKVSKGEFDN